MNDKILQDLTPQQLIEFFIYEELMHEINKPLKTMLSDAMEEIAKIIEDYGNEIIKFFEVDSWKN